MSPTETNDSAAAEWATFLRSPLPCCGRRRFRKSPTTFHDHIHYWGGIDDVMVHECETCGAAWADVQ
jgi:hypothetical protein